MERGRIPNVSRVLALIGDTGHLYPAARHHFNPSTNLVIYGHTHKWELTGMAARDLDAFKNEIERFFRPHLKHQDLIEKIKNVTDAFDPGEEPFEGHVYANCGTWISGTGGTGKTPPATYVEVIDDDRIRTVHVREYGMEKPLKTRRIYLGSYAY